MSGSSNGAGGSAGDRRGSSGGDPSVSSGGDRRSGSGGGSECYGRGDSGAGVGGLEALVVSAVVLINVNIKLFQDAGRQQDQVP